MVGIELVLVECPMPHRTKAGANGSEGSRRAARWQKIGVAGARVFKAGKPPQVKACRSAAVRDGKTRRLVDNPIDRNDQRQVMVLSPTSQVRGSA